MGGWASFLFAYLLGGLTFLPLTVIAVFAHAYFTLPPLAPDGPGSVSETNGNGGSENIIQSGDDLAPLEATKTANKDDTGNGRPHPAQDGEVAAGYFAVCREYVPMGINAKPIERATPVGSTTVAAPSQSVYQTMYRSIFDRKQPQGPLDNKNTVSQRPKNAGNVFYVVLRHGHLMLFDDEEQLEVRHVVSLAHHDISIYSGGDVTPEGELFIKKNALCLSRRQDGPEVGPDSHLSKPFYLFSEDSSAKEDFYFALIRNQEQYFEMSKKAPKPLPFDVKNIIQLVQKLHSSEDHVPTRWLNAMIGRIFLGLYKTADLEHFIREKLTKKISRVKTPSFLTNIVIRKIDTGDSAPVLLNPRHKDLNIEGECAMEGDVKYSGNFRLEVAATVRIDLGSRFKVREVDLVLAVVLRKLEGHVLFKIKPPPSNRVWLSFQSMPKMEMTIEPIVSTRQITYTLILRQIENRIKEVIAETLVQPFWDDMPFFNTEHKKWRGGIFEGDDAVPPSVRADTNLAQEGDVDAVDNLEETSNNKLQADMQPLEKSYSAPLADNVPSTGLFGRKIIGSRAPTNPVAATTGADPKASSSVPFPRTLRSGSMSGSSDPVTKTDTAHADVFKPSSSPPDHATSMMAALSARSQPTSTIPTPVDSPARPASVALARGPSQSFSSLESNAEPENEKDMEKTPVASGRRSTTSSTESVPREDHAGSAPHSPSLKGSLRSNTGSLKSNASSIAKGFFARRDTNTAEESSQSSSGQNAHDANQKRTALSAVANAATQARQWGWNAIQRQKEGRNGGGPDLEPLDLNKPMGRGRPLPPPGTPLPRPEKGSKVTQIQPPPKRKPVPAPALPDRPVSQETIHSHHNQEEHRATPPPALPSRRFRDSGSNKPDEHSSDEMLIIAAPMNSEPSTPMDEGLGRFDEPGHVQPWAEDDDTTTANVSFTSDGNRLHLDADDTRSCHSGTTENGSKLLSGKLDMDSPIEARPVSALQYDDDDDYSGWLDNADMEDDIPDVEVAGEGLQGQTQTQTQTQPQTQSPHNTATLVESRS